MARTRPVEPGFVTSEMWLIQQLATRHRDSRVARDVGADDQDRADLGDRAAKAGQHNGHDSGGLTGGFSFGLPPRYDVPVLSETARALLVAENDATALADNQFRRHGRRCRDRSRESGPQPVST